MKIGIFVVTHKKKVRPISDIYIPIQVGKCFSGEEIEKLSDDVGEDNIAIKNKNFCELTAQYWIWKNIQEYDYIGICHYRRFFTKRFLVHREKYILKEKDIEKVLEKYDAIMPTKRYYTFSLNHQFYGQERKTGYKRDVDELRIVIQELYPDYIPIFDKVMHGYSGYFYNMFILSKENFAAYSEWLFNILFELEKRLDITNYNTVEARIYGYLSERLINVWVIKNNLKIKEYPVINTEEPVGEYLDLQYFFLKNRVRLAINYHIQRDEDA